MPIPMSPTDSIPTTGFGGVIEEEEAMVDYACPRLARMCWFG